MKKFITILIILFLTAGIGVPAWGDILTTTTSASLTQFTIEGATAPFNYGISGQMASICFDTEFDLGLRPGVGLSYGSINGSDFATIYPRIDWGFQILDYVFRISEGYQLFAFQLNDTTPAVYSYAGFTLGITGYWKISEMLSLNGTVLIPQTGNFYRDNQTIGESGPVAFGYNYGLRFTALPIISFTLNYFYTGIGDQDSPFQLENRGASIGAILRW